MDSKSYSNYLTIIFLIFSFYYSPLYAQTAKDFLNKGKSLLNINPKPYANAIDEFSKAIDLDNQMEEAYYHRGVCYLAEGFFKSALTDFNKAIALDPDNSKTYQYRAKSKYHLKKYQDALWDLNKAIKLAPSEDDYYLNRAEVYYKLYRYKQALNDCKKALDRATGINYAVALSTRAWIKMEEGKFEEAYEDLIEAKKMATNTNIVRIRMGNYYFKIGNVEEALTEYLAVEKLHADKFNRINATAFCNRALVRLSFGTTKEALRDANKAIQINRHHFESFAVRAIVNHNLGDMKASQRDINTYTTNRELDDDDYGFLVDNIVRYAKKGDIWKEAERIAEKIAQNNPNYKNYLLYAKVLHKLNKSTSAVGVLKKSIGWAKKEGKNEREALALINEIEQSHSDRKPPVIRIISPASSMTASARGVIVVEKANSLTVIGTAQDESGIAKVLVNGNEATLEPNGDFVGVTQLTANKDTKIQVVAYDKRGNTAEAKLLVRKEDAQNTQTPTAPSNRAYLSSSIIGVHYALIIATDKYDFWPDLSNPINDGRTLGRTLKEDYGYRVEYLINPTKEQIMLKLKEYIKKEYDFADQVMIFCAGHGDFDDDIKQGFIIAKDSKYNDPTGGSQISQVNFRDLINKIPCRATLACLDICFSGAFDEVIARRGREDNFTKSQLDFITRTKRYVAKHYLTSGGKEYVPDGAPGKHSPFAYRLLKALREVQARGEDGILTMPEVMKEMQGLEPRPRHGTFGDNEPGSDFLFIYRY